jgi:MoxR-like ATPase
MVLKDPPILAHIQEAQVILQQIREEIHRVIVGQQHLITCLFIGLLGEGHILLEGLPGIAKTLSANTLAKIVHCDYKRIQFTPDLLPADLIGTPIFNPKEGTFTTKKGPIFTNILLADEINRAPAKVQSALLEVMQEKQVTINGETFFLSQPFLVIATQNPIEQEGTYPLAEAQTDRFMMKVKVEYPTYEEEKLILNRVGSGSSHHTVKPLLEIATLLHLRQLVENIYIDDLIIEYLLHIVHATRNPKHYQIKIDGLLEYGASPRASIALKQASKCRALLAGRYFVTPQDIKDVAFDVLRHRLHLSYEAEAENLTADHIIQRILDALPIP